MKNKKLFAILTLVCFMFTLMPVAAFAAATDFSANASVFATVESNEEVTKGDEVDVQITLKDVAGNQFKGEQKEVYVWAENVAGQPNDAFEVPIANGTAGVYKVYVNQMKEFTVKFHRAGTYTLKAALTNPLTTNEVKDIVLFAGAADAYKTVKVNPAAVETEFWGVRVNADDVSNKLLLDGEEVGTVVVDANGVKTETVTLTVVGGAEGAEGQGPAVSGYPVALDTNSSNIEINKTNAVTNHNGQVEFKVAGLREGIYKVYVTVGDLEGAILVQVGASIANDIEVIKAPKAPVAKDTKVSEYASLIRFQITDVNGNVVTNCDDNCTVAGPAKNSDEAPYVTIVEQPAASKLEDHNIWIELADKANYYVLASDKQFDVEGTYTVKVILDNGRFATVTWEVKKFQTPVEIVIDAPESVELGTAVDVELTYVDANGVEKLAKKDAELAATGYAISWFDDEVNTDAKATVYVKTDEKYAGSVITLTAVSDRYNLVAVKEVKVAKEAKEIKFAEGSLAVNVNNKVEWNVVDEDGNPVVLTNLYGEAKDQDVTTTIKYIVLDKPADAKVSIYDATEKPFDGDGVMALTSNKVGNVTVQAIVKVEFGGDWNDLDALQTKYYTGTQIFAVGTEGVGDVVVMSIGSNEIVINDAKATIDAAPIVENNRTFVPFRALAEAFGATVAYDEATQAVTAELNGVTVVMTIGSAEYTVNGEAKTADVAPFINGSRTMVPVRFAAEAFGIKVIPTYDENGATADILFNL